MTRTDGFTVDGEWFVKVECASCKAAQFEIGVSADYAASFFIVFRCVACGKRSAPFEVPAV